MNLTTKSRILATEKHKSQRYGEYNYHYHLVSVVEICNNLFDCDEDLVSLCWLHDIHEDCKDVTLEYLLREGFHESLVQSIDAISKRESESRKEYLTRCMGNKNAHKVKIADTLANLTESVRIGDYKRVRKYSEQLTFLHKEK